MDVTERTSRSRFGATLAVAAAIAAGVVVAIVAGRSPQITAWTRLTAAGLCSVGALVVVNRGWAGRLAEISLTGTMLTVLSVLHAVAAATTPGTLVAAVDANAFAAGTAVPLAALAAVPLVLPDGRLRAHLSRGWRAWTIVWLVVAATLAVLLLGTSMRPPLPGPLGVAAVTIAGVGVFGTIGWRHLSLYQVGRQRLSAVVGCAFLAMAVTGPVFLLDDPPRPAVVLLLVADIAWSFVAIGAVGMLGWRLRDLATVLAPVTNRDPLVAMQLGLDPSVAQFVRQVARKDPGTRGHILRAGELALRVAVRAGIRGRELRELGIGALLHDIGKLAVPDDVLRKPGALTLEEYEVVKEHAAAGGHLMSATPALAPSAAYVRWHHERPDGGGYPDGLTADEIPLGVAIVSVCDAYDAMTQHRHYRRALTTERALEILDENAGTQFDPSAVRLLRDELAALPDTPAVFASLGGAAPDDAADVSCGHAVPIRSASPQGH